MQALQMGIARLDPRRVQVNGIEVVEVLRNDEPKTGQHLVRAIESSCLRRGWTVRLTQWESRQELLDFLWGLELECAYGKRPHLHIEAHGSPEGIGFQDELLLTWEELQPWLSRLATATRVNLIVFVAACYGINVLKTLNVYSTVPALAFVGAQGKVSPGVIRATTEDYYGRLLDLGDGDAAVRSLEEGGDGFVYVHAVRMFDHFVRQTMAERALPARAAQIDAERLRRLRAEGYSPLEAGERTARCGRSLPELARKRVRDRFFLLEQFPENRGQLLELGQ